MQSKTPLVRVLFPRCQKLVGRAVLGLFLFVAIATSMATLYHPRTAAAVAPANLNFQARLMTATGGIVPDGNYHIEFKLYNTLTSSGSSQGSCTSDANCLWTETRTTGNLVQVKNGYLTVNLGSVTGFGAVDFSQQLWLTMRVGGAGGSAAWDPEMNPRLQLTAVPYAFKAGDSATLGGIASTGFIQNTTSPQTSSNFNISGNGTIGGNLNVNGNASLIKPTTNSTTAFQIQPAGSTTPVFNVDTTNSRVGIGTNAPSSQLDVVGDINTSANLRTGGTTRIDNAGNITGTTVNVTGSITGGTIFGVASDMSGYMTSNTTNVDAGKWTKLATCTLASQFYGCRAAANLVMTGDGTNNGTRARIDWRVKQQAAFGTNPLVSLEISDVNSLTTSNFVSVITSNAGPATAELWGLIPGSYQTWAINPILNSGEVRATWLQSQAFSVAVSAGTQTAAVYADEITNSLNSITGYKFNGTTGATTTCSGGNFLQNAVVQGGIITGGTCIAGAAGGATSVGAISGTSNANGATIASGVLNLTAADGTNGGVLTNTTQTIAGAKTFSGSLAVAGAVTLNGNTTIGDATSDRLTLTAQVLGGSPLVLQGATDNGFTTTVALVDPTANNTITLPNASGTVAVSATGNIALNAAGQISLTGTVGTGNGGTGSTSYTTNGVIYSNGSALVSTAAGSSGNCLKSNGAGSAPTYGSCGTASTLQDAYTTSGPNTTPQIQLSNANGGLILRDAASSTIGNLFQLQNSAGTVNYFGVTASGFSIQNAAATNALTFDSVGGHLKIYNPSDVTKFADVYYDNTNNEAVFAASAGNTTRVGAGNGNIQLQLSNAADVLVGTKTVTLGSAYSANDFSFSRAITAGANSLTGNVVKIESTSTGTGTLASNLLYINENNGSATGNLILAAKSGAAKFTVDVNGNISTAGTLSATGLVSASAGVSVAAGQSYTGAGAVNVNSAAASNLTLSAGTTGSVIAKAATNSTASFQVQNASAVGLLTADSSGMSIQIGSATTDGNAVELVLDSYNVATDPASGVNGAMYYNSSLGKFRCFEVAWKNCINSPTNSSTADQAVASATTAYLTGSAITIPTGGLKVGTTFTWRMSVAKTSATGTNPSSFDIRFGTNGTTADTSRMNLSLGNSTAATDVGVVTITVTVRSVSASGVIAGNISLVHNTPTAGISAGGSTVNTISTAFDNTTANAIIGLSVTSGTSITYTFQQVQTTTTNL